MRLVGGTIFIGVAVAACSFFVESGELTGAVASMDAGLDRSSEPEDAASLADAAPPCAVTAPFSTTQTVTPPGGAASPRLSADELTLYFQKAEPAGKVGVFTATRSKPTGAFESPQPISTVNTVFIEGNPFVTRDGRALYFTSDRPGGPGRFDLYVATRAGEQDPFDGVAVVLGASSARDEMEPWVTDDGELWFARVETDAAADIHRLVIGTANAATPVEELNSDSQESYPVVSADGLEVFFARKTTTTTSDIYVAHRERTSDPFLPPDIVAELQTANDEAPGWLSADRCRLYFERFVGGRNEVMVAERSR